MPGHVSINDLNANENFTLEQYLGDGGYQEDLVSRPEDVNIHRIDELANLIDKVPQKNFNMFLITSGIGHPSSLLEVAQAIKDGEEHLPDCSSAGCVIGWMPALWPEECEWNNCGSVVLKDRMVGDSFQTACCLLGITYSESFYLFASGWNYRNIDKDDRDNVFKTAVVRRLRYFAAKKRKELEECKAGNLIC